MAAENFKDSDRLLAAKFAYIWLDSISFYHDNLLG